MHDLNALSLDDLYHRLSAGGHVRRLLDLAREEDLGDSAGDITSEVCIPAGHQTEATLVARQAGVVAGLATLPEVLEVFGGRVELELHASDGEEVAAGRPLATLRGDKRQILTVERIALNLVGRLSGIATMTARFVRAAADSARVYDTRKTTPGLRILEKYAVRCGGGYCHRIGLHDGVLIKDNHLAGVGLESLADFVADAAKRARALHPDLLFVEVEVDSLEQFQKLLSLTPGAIDIVLLDNMTPEQLRRASAMRAQAAPTLQLEASGGVRLETIAEIAGTGVDRISIGALTHSAAVLDVALDIAGTDIGMGTSTTAGSGA